MRSRRVKDRGRTGQLAQSPDAPQAGASAAQAAAVALMERLANELKGPSSAVVYGEPVTEGGVTVVPVAEVGFGFGGSAGPATGTGEDGAGIVGGGVKARPRGFIEIKNGTATYRPLRNPWLDAALPLAALAAGAALPGLVRRVARRRPG
ncbi:GerW family sporulation protein [Streptomyces aureocirculatus]|uniref:GerW family sporulation protein n=1 Tax=Streptomyces aureocirculatus TaxID=67275 RepID=UPI00099C6607|nr:GerW family sporulation protein [Streptomyces aureocirculatus]